MDSLLTNNSSGFAAGSTLALDTANGSGSYGTNIAATNFGLSKLGNNVLTLSGNNAYAGATSIAGTAGGIVVGANNALGTAAGNTTVAAGTSLGFSGGINYSTAETIVGSGQGSAAVGAFTNTQRGFVQSVSGSNTFAGAIQINATGETRIGTQNGAQLTLSGAVTAVSGATVLFRAGDTSGDFVTLSNSGNSWDTDTQIYNANTGTGAGVRLGIDNALPKNVSVKTSASGGSAAMLDLAGYNQELNGLTANSYALKISNSDNTRTSILTLNNTANRNTSSGTVIQDGAGKIQVVKIGSFDQIIQTPSTYTGGTLIKNGSITLQSGNDRLATTGTVTLGDATTTGKLVLSESTTARNQTLAGLLTSGLGGSVVGATTSANSVLTLNIASTNSFSGTLGGSTAAENSLALTKTGAGTLTLSGAGNTYTGTTAINAGTLQIDASATMGATTGALTMGTGVAGTIGTVGNLTLNENATKGAMTVAQNTSTTTGADVAQLSILSGKTLTVSSLTLGVAASASGDTKTALATGAANTGGTLTVNGDMAVGVQGVSKIATTVLDLSGLSNFNLTSTAGTLRVGYGPLANGTLTLANANNINVGTISVGETTGSDNSGQTSTVNLGAGSNIINATTINIGRVKASADMKFAGSTGTVNIAGTNGGAAKANITIANHTNGTYVNGASSLQLAGHDATVQAGAVVIGQKAGGGGGNVTASLTFDTGTFTADSISTAVGSATASSAILTGGFTLGTTSASTGTLTVANDFVLANNASSSTLSSVGSFIILGGTATINGNITDTSTTATGSSTTTLTLNGGTLDMTNGNIGGTGASGNRYITNLNFQSGTLKNVAQINNGAGLTKTTAGTLILDGANSYTGTTLISDGVLQVNGGSAISDTTGLVSLTNFAGATFQVVATEAIGALTGGGTTGGTVSIDASQTLTLVNGTQTFGGKITGLGALRLNASAVTQTLTGYNDYAGATSINYGVLNIQHANALGGTANGTTVLNGAALKLQTASPTSFAAEALTLTTGGSTTPILQNVSGDNTWNGTIDATTSSSLSHVVRVSSDSGLLTLANTITLSTKPENQFVLQGDGNIEVTGKITGASQVSSSATGGGTRTLSNATNDYTGNTNVNGGTLRLGASEVIPNGTGKGNVSVAGTFDLNGKNETINGLTGAGIVDNVTTGTTNTLTLGDGDATGNTFSGVIKNTTGTLSLVKIGTGIQTLSGTNTYGGGTTIKSGTLALGNNASAAGSAGIFIGDTTGASANATLQVGNNVTFANAITVQTGNAGTKSINSTTSGATPVFSGGVTLNDNLTINNNAATSNLNFRTSAFALNDKTLTVNSNNPNAGTVTFESTAPITGTIASAINFGGTTGTTGKFRLNAANTFSGTATISGASLGVGGTLALELNNVNALQNATLDTGASGNQAVTFILTGTTYNIGALTGSDDLDITGNNTISVGSKAVDTVFSGAIGNSAGTGSLTKVGGNALTLSGSNSYTGGTTITSGTLVAGNADALGATTGSLAVNGGTLDLNGYSATVGLLSGSSSGLITTGSNVAVVLTGSSASSSEYAGRISDGAGTVGLAKQGAGALTLSASNSYTGTTTITSGTLQVGDGMSGSISSSSAVTVASAGTLAVNQANGSTFGSTIANEGAIKAIASGSNTLSAAISGTGTLTQSGAGTLTLSASNSYSGGTTISGGTLVVGDDHALGTGLMTLDGGSLASSGTAARFITNDITVAQTSTIGQITGDTITFSGTAGGTGTLNVNLGNAFTTMTVAPTSGEFAPGEIKLTQGTLVLGGADKIGDNTAINLAGGTFNTGGNSDSVGALTFSGSSTLDFGSSKTGTLTFASAGSSSGLLTIQNWLGGYGGGSPTHLVFNSSVTGVPGFLGNIQFAGHGVGANQISFGESGQYELVPVPEPATIIGALAFLGLIVLRERRRIVSLWKKTSASPGR